jgi:transposase
MTGDIFLKPKEARRIHVMEQVVAGKLTSREAAELLSLSSRQIFRIKGGIGKEGIAALAHKNRGRKPKHAVSQEVRAQLIALATSDYKGASLVQMAELLQKHNGLSLSPKTISRIIKKAGISNPHSHKAAKRRRTRIRKGQEGMMAQCDASPFAWLEERGPVMNLHGAIDDATGKVLGLYFRPTEDSLGYLNMLYQMVTNFGVPQSLYSDRHTIFFSPKSDKLSSEEQLQGIKVPLTRFGKVLEELGINQIKARSPQGKGRIERLWGTLQSRLMVELRLAGISTIEEANRFLPQFIIRYNNQFSVKAVDPKSAFAKKPKGKAADYIICLKDERLADRGSAVSFKGNHYQLLDNQGKTALLRFHSKVAILTHLDGSVNALYEGKAFPLEEIPKPEKITAEMTKLKTTEPIKTAKKPYKPAPDHPWKKRLMLT